MLGVMSALSLFRRRPAPTWHTLSAQRKREIWKKGKKWKITTQQTPWKTGPKTWMSKAEWGEVAEALLLGLAKKKICVIFWQLSFAVCVSVSVNVCVCVVCVCLCVGKLCYLIQASFQAALQLWNQQSTQTTQMAKIFSTNWRSKFMAILVEKRERDKEKQRQWKTKEQQHENKISHNEVNRITNYICKAISGFSHGSTEWAVKHLFRGCRLFIVLYATRLK